MAFLNSLDIAGSALTASRLRMDTVSQNISNADVTRTEAGGPYRRKMVVYEAQEGGTFRKMLNDKMGNEKGGVKVTGIVEDQSEFTPVYNPEHPDANVQGYVMMPNVNPMQEMLDMMAATRAYDLNITSLNAMKGMATKALEIGR